MSRHVARRVGADVALCGARMLPPRAHVAAKTYCPQCEAIVRQQQAENTPMPQPVVPPDAEPR